MAIENNQTHTQANTHTHTYKYSVYIYNVYTWIHIDTSQPLSSAKNGYDMTIIDHILVI